MEGTTIITLDSDEVRAIIKKHLEDQGYEVEGHVWLRVEGLTEGSGAMEHIVYRFDQAGARVKVRGRQ